MCSSEISGQNSCLGDDVSSSTESVAHCSPKQTITGAYYRDNIPENACIEALNRKAETGSVLVREMHQNMSEII